MGGHFRGLAGVVQRCQQQRRVRGRRWIVFVTHRPRLPLHFALCRGAAPRLGSPAQSHGSLELRESGESAKRARARSRAAQAAGAAVREGGRI
eukprot:6339996-Prymnesium_polylepis.1